MLGDFFVYGDRSTSANELHTMDNDNGPLSVEDGREGWHQRLYGPLMRSFNINAESPVKKAINIKDIDDSGATWHLVSYYRPVDILQGRLQTPSMNHGFVLPLCHGQRHSFRAYGTLSHAHHAGGHYVSLMRRQWHSPLSTQQHVEVSWPCR